MRANVEVETESIIHAATDKRLELDYKCCSGYGSPVEALLNVAWTWPAIAPGTSRP